MYFIGGFILYYLIKTFIVEKYIRDRINSTIYLFLLRLLDIVVFIFCSYQLVKDIDFFNKLILGLVSNTALIIAVLGFSLQSALKHIVAGLLVANSKAFKIGDRITLRSRDLTGYVEEITLRHVIIRTYMNERVVIPNSILNDEVLINNDLKDSSTSYPISFLIPIDSNVDQVIDLVKSILSSNQDIVNDKIEVLVSDITIHGIIIKTFIWTKKIEDSFRVASDIRKEIISQFQQQGIELSFLQSMKK